MRKIAICLVAGVLLTLAITSTWRAYAPDSFESTFGRFFVSRTVDVAHDIDLGQQGSGVDCEFTIQVTNRGDAAARVSGFANNCSCLRAQNLPLEIPPATTRDIVVKWQLPAITKADRAVQDAVVLISNGKLLPYRVKMHADVTPGDG